MPGERPVSRTVGRNGVSHFAGEMCPFIMREDSSGGNGPLCFEYTGECRSPVTGELYEDDRPIGNTHIAQRGLGAWTLDPVWIVRPVQVEHGRICYHPINSIYTDEFSTSGYDRLMYTGEYREPLMGEWFLSRDIRPSVQKLTILPLVLGPSYILSAIPRDEHILGEICNGPIDAIADEHPGMTRFYYTGEHRQPLIGEFFQWSGGVMDRDVDEARISDLGPQWIVRPLGQSQQRESSPEPSQEENERGEREEMPSTGNGSGSRSWNSGGGRRLARTSHYEWEPLIDPAIMPMRMDSEEMQYEAARLTFYFTGEHRVVSRGEWFISDENWSESTGYLARCTDRPINGRQWVLRAIPNGIHVDGEPCIPVASMVRCDLPAADMVLEYTGEHRIPEDGEYFVTDEDWEDEIGYIRRCDRLGVSGLQWALRSVPSVSRAWATGGVTSSAAQSREETGQSSQSSSPSSSSTPPSFAIEAGSRAKWRGVQCYDNPSIPYHYVRECECEIVTVGAGVRKDLVVIKVDKGGKQINIFTREKFLKKIG